jgi:hypothetical protein
MDMFEWTASGALALVLVGLAAYGMWLRSRRSVAAEPSAVDAASNKLSYLRLEINYAENTYYTSANWYRRRYYASTLSTIILSGVITIIAGWKPFGDSIIAGWKPFGDYASNIILFLGATSTIISSWGAFFSPKESWLLNSSTLVKVIALRKEIEFLVLEPTKLLIDDLATVESLRKEYQSIVDAHNRAWFELRSSKDAPFKPGPPTK